MTDVENYLDQALGLMAENKLAVWDFLESQRHLVQIVKDRKIHVLVSYLSILSKRALLNEDCPLKSNYCADNGPWCARQFRMKKCLKCDFILFKFFGDKIYVTTSNLYNFGDRVRS